MNHFIFKSPKRLIKNEPITLRNLIDKLMVIQTEQRHARQDLVNINDKLERLLIDKHLQFQVDDFYHQSESSIEDSPHKDMADLD